MKLNIKKQKIGSSVYNVEYVADLQDKKGTDLAGRIWEIDKKIKICTDGTEQNQLQALLHEDLHGVCWEYGIKDIEDFITVFSNGIYALIVDNPKFIQKILDYTKKIKK
ncbi:unnamed protein product [marine sediment metagenome]|uniref:Phage protein n=1 Tax=marine sediment metagenome TaxID=412755 RepID=X1ECM3_9ZZZZ